MNKNIFKQNIILLLASLKKLATEFKLFLSDNILLLTKVILPLLIISCGYFSCSYSQKSIKNNVEKIFSLSDDIRAFYVNKHDYWGLNTQKVIDEHIVSQKYINGGKIVLSGGIDVLIGKGPSGETIMPLVQEFDIVVKDLNKAQCMSYAEAELSQDELLKLTAITVVNSSGSYVFEWNGVNKLPVQKYDTKSLCQKDNNTVIWTIK